MNFENTVRDLLEEVMNNHPSLFLIDFSIDSSGAIRVVVDGDRGVVLQDCINISRHIEHNIDREEHDFSLEVTSVDATAPLLKPRQYVKNIGRKIKIDTHVGEAFDLCLCASCNCEDFGSVTSNTHFGADFGDILRQTGHAACQ